MHWVSRNLATCEINKAKKEFLDKQLGTEPTTKKFYQVFNRIYRNTSGENKAPKTLNAEILNNFFINIGPSLASKFHGSSTPKYYGKRNPSTLVIQPTSASEVIRVINKNNKKGLNYDCKHSSKNSCSIRTSGWFSIWVC